MKLTIQPGVKFAFTKTDPSYLRLENEFDTFVQALKLFHNIEFEFHPESSIGWLPPYYIAGDPVWLENQYYRDQLRIHYRFTKSLLLWDIGYPEVDYSEVKKLFYDKTLYFITDKLLESDYINIKYDWSWNHFKYYATHDVVDPKRFYNYKDYHMPMLLSDKILHNVLRYDGTNNQLRDFVFTDFNGNVTDSDDFIHTLVSVVDEPQLGFKTYYALSRGHLVMLYSAKKQVERLGAKGFWLSDLFDLTYDKEDDDFARLEQFVECLRKFVVGSSKKFLTEFYLDNLGKLRNNQKIFFDLEYDNRIEDIFKT